MYLWKHTVFVHSQQFTMQSLAAHPAVIGKECTDFIDFRSSTSNLLLWAIRSWIRSGTLWHKTFYPEKWSQMKINRKYCWEKGIFISSCLPPSGHSFCTGFWPCDDFWLQCQGRAQVRPPLGSGSCREHTACQDPSEFQAQGRDFFLQIL